MFNFKNKPWLAALWLVAIVYCFIEAGGNGDLYIFLSAAADLSAHENIFENTYVDGYHYYYSVLFALFLKPFCYLPFKAVKFGWLLLNLGLFFKMFQTLATSVYVKRLSEKKQMIFLICTFVFSLRFLLDNIHYSQITILILSCCIYGICNILRGREISGSLILALGINIKLLPIVFLPYLLYRGCFKAFFMTLCFYIISLLLPSIIIGHDYNMLLLHTWLNLVNPANQSHMLDVDERSFHGLSTLLSTLFVKDVPDVYAMPLKRNIADVSLQSLSRIILGVRLALVAFTLYFLKAKPFTKPASLTSSLLEMSYMLLLIPLIFPHQQHYAFLFTVPAFAMVAYRLIDDFNTMAVVKRSVIITLLSLVFLSASLKLLLGVYNNYYEHFKILTYGALLLIPLLVWVSLKKEKTALTA